MRLISVFFFVLSFAFGGVASAQVNFVLANPPGFTPPGTVDFMDKGHFDDNGLEDLILSYQSGLNRITGLFMQTSPGVFEPGFQGINLVDYEVACLDVADADFDGQDEILIVFNHPSNPPFVAVRYATPTGPPANFTTASQHSFSLPIGTPPVSNCRFAPLRSSAYLDIIITGNGLNGFGVEAFGYDSMTDEWTVPLNFNLTGPSISDPYGIAAGDYEGDGNRHLIIGRSSDVFSHIFSVDLVNSELNFEQTLFGAGGHLETFEMDGRDQTFGMMPFGNQPFLTRIISDDGMWSQVPSTIRSHMMGWVGRLQKTPSRVELITADPDASDSITLRTFDGLNYSTFAGSGGAAANRQIMTLDFTGDGRPGFVALTATGILRWYAWQNTCGAFGQSCLSGSSCGGGTCVKEPQANESFVLPYRVRDAYFAPLFTTTQFMDMVTLSDEPSKQISVHGGIGGSPVWQGGFANGTRARALAVGDCDRDGHLDLVAGMNVAGVPSFVAATNVMGGQFALGVPTPIASTGVVSDVALGDVDGDGLLDLAVILEAGQPMVFRGFGSCVFSATATFTGTSNVVGGKLLFANLSGDKKAELLVAGSDGTLATFYSFGEFDSGSWSYTSMPSGGLSFSTILDLAVMYRATNVFLAAVGQAATQSINIATFASNSVGPASKSLAVGDFGETPLGAVYAVPGGYAYSTSLVAAASFTERLLRSGLDPSIVRIARVRGERPDIVTFSPTGTTTTVELDAIDTPFFSPVISSAPAFLHDVSDFTFADTNGNGFLDFVVAARQNISPNNHRSGIFRNDGPLGFVTLAPFANPAYVGNPTGIAVGDLDGDGNLDVFVNGNDLSAPYIVSSSGIQSLSIGLPCMDNSQCSLEEICLPAGCQYGGGGPVRLYDLNNDGQLDIIRGLDARQRTVYSLDGGTTWTTLGTGTLTSLDVGDINGDGFPDIVTGSSLGITQFTNDGAGFFGSNPLSGLGTNWRVFLTDFDSDGDLDLVTVDLNAGVDAVSRRQNTGGVFGAPDESNIAFAGGSPADATMGDVNSNGRDELVLAWSDGDQMWVYVYQLSPFRLLENVSITALNNQVAGVRLADMDNDGDLDIITAHNNTDPKFQIFKNNHVSSPAVSGNNLNSSNTTTTGSWGRPNLRRAFADGGGGRPILGETVDVPITLYDREEDPTHLEVEFSLNRVDVWLPAAISALTPTGTLVPPANLATSRTGTTHILRWNIEADRTNQGVEIEGSDIRLRAKIKQTPSTSTYPIWTSESLVVSPPMQVLLLGCTGCAANEVCLHGECRVDCAIVDPCAVGECFSSDSISVCLPPGNACDSITCPSGTSCQDGACFPTCDSSDDCTPPSLCFGLVCQDPNDLCAGILCPPTETCFLGSCFPESVCADDSACVSSDVCYEPGCGPQDPCDILGACPAGHSCHQGACFLDCSALDPCSPPLECYGFGCALPNDPCANVECGVNRTCHQGACFPECSTSVDCTAPFDICYDATFCGSADLCADVTCPLGFDCYEGGCFQNCTDTDDCSPPFVCFEELCRDGVDPCDAISCPEGSSCYQGGCFLDCATNGNCDPPLSACFDATVCLETSDLCAEIVCPGGMICHEGQCLESCSAADPCATPNVCYTEYCGAPGDPCNGIMCPEGMGCYEGGCYSGCMMDDECALPDLCHYDVGMATNPERCATGGCDSVFCPLGQSCFGGGCYPECDAFGSCDDPNHVCYDNNLCMPQDLCEQHYCPVGQTCTDGSCFVACSANSDCPGYVGFGAVFTNVGEVTNLSLSEAKAAGVAWGDFNNDGCLDLFLNTASSGRSKLYQSDCAANPIFSDVTSVRAPHFLTVGRERSMIVADWNNDGFLDAAHNTSNHIEIYANSGTPDFNLTHSKQINPSNSEGMGWIDVDGDRWLDLIFEDQSGGVRLFRNDGVGDFASTPGVGLNSSGHNGDYCAVADLNLDGHVDIICRKPGTSSPADLYMNDGDGTFTASSAFNQDGVNVNKGGVTVCDVDNDGLFDVIWTDSGTNQIWRQSPVGVFSPTGEPAASSGFALPTSASYNDVLCGDVDHDGRQDLFWVGANGSYLFLNKSTPGSLNFVRRNLGINSAANGRSGAMADYNKNGSLDILVHKGGNNELWQNPRTDKRYLMIRALVDLSDLPGRPAGTTRDGIGATVFIRDADGGILGLREVNGGRGRGSQDPATMHFGLPYGPNVPYHLTVRWPHGEEVQRCVVPSSLGDYQVVTITDTDSDNISACLNAGDWSALIELPGDEFTGQFCFGNRCAGDACEDIICPKGSACYGGNCRPLCPTGSCLGSDVCIDGVCVEGPCDDGDFQCPVNFSCLNGECAPSCTQDTDCDAGQFCYQGVCVVPDCTGVTCPTNHSCHEGLCFPDCTTDGDCSAGQGCYDGRCATDGCAAMDLTYDSDFYSRDTRGHISVTRPGLPWFWPRPFIGAVGQKFTDWAGVNGSSLLSAVVPMEKTARVALFLDKTDPDGDHPEGRYVLWFNQGANVPGQGAAQAAYRVQFDGISPEKGFDNDDGESVEIMDTDLSNHEVAHAYITSAAGQTGGVAFSRIGSDATSSTWTIRIDAEFSGDIRRWEWLNADGSVVQLDPAETLQIAITEVGDKFYAREAGKACTTAAPGICSQGIAYCQTWELRCQQTVLPWMFEICDAKDNNCNGSIDEPEHIRFPGVEWRDDASSWQILMTMDKSQAVQEAVGFVPRGPDDRVGSVDIQATDGSGSIQAWNRAVLAMHRDLRTNSLSLLVANGLDFTGAVADVGDYDVETRLRFPGEHTINEAFPAFWDDRKDASTEDEIPEDFELDRMNLDWEIEQLGSGTTARREADAIAFMTRWSGASPSLAEVEMRYQWRRHADNSSAPDRLDFGIHQPSRPFRSVSRQRSAYFRISPTEREDTACYANGATTPGGCELGYYTCNVGGAVTCSAPLDAACNRCVDADGDTFFAYDEITCPTGRDCNDNDININPDAAESCNGMDSDCDGEIDIKDDAAYLALWGEPRNAAAASCPVGMATCGPADCQFRNVCICPDGPMDPMDPPDQPCYCGEGLEP